MPKKGENIYKRKDDRWEARYVKERRPDGSCKFGYCYGKTYREAKEKAAVQKAALINETVLSADASQRRFKHFCDEWLLINRDRVKQSTYVKYCAMIEKHIKPSLGDCRVQALSSVNIEQFSHELLSEKNLSPKTVKDILTALHSIIKYMAKQAQLPLHRLEVIYPKVPKKEMRVLSRDEQSVFVKYLLEDIDEYKFGVLLALLTGMRIGEVCALRWENISLADKTIKVDSTMQRLKNYESGGLNKTQVYISDPKSDNSVRLIPMTDYTVSLCKKFMHDRPKAFVLTGEKGRYVEPRMLQYKLKCFTEECGLAGVHFHTLRHTFATRCVEVDFEIKSLSEILGHSSPRITLERYVHSSMTLKRENMDKLAAIGL